MRGEDAQKTLASIKKYLSPVNDKYGEMELIGPYQIRGVIIQQSYRRQRKKYPIY